MRPLIALALAATIGLAPAAMANDKHHDARPGRGGAPAAGHCPPGLARKDPPCIPPGQARKAGHAVGDRYDGELVIVDRTRYDLPSLRDNG